MRSRMFGLIAVLAVLGLVGAACSSSSSGSSPSGSPVPSAGSSSGGSLGTIKIGNDTANNQRSKEVSGASSVDLEADNHGSSDYYFNPTIITGKAGQKLSVTITNNGSTTHNFSLVDGSANKDIQPGQSTTVTVTLPQSGSMEFFCRFHRGLGMAGEFTTS